MAKVIIKYSGDIKPEWIEDGAYFFDGNYSYGVTEDSSVPGDITPISQEDFINDIKGQTILDINTETGDDMLDESGKEAMAQLFIGDKI